MVTSEYNLLRHARRALRAALPRISDNEAGTLVRSVDIVLNELMLRQDSSFYDAAFDEAEGLIAEGLALTGQSASITAAGDGTRRGDVTVNARRLLPQLADIVGAIGETADPERADYLRRVTDWEARLYRRSMDQASLGEGGSQPASVLFTADRFAAYLRRRFPEWGDIAVSDFHAVPGGFSKVTIMATLRDTAHGERSVVIRVEPPISSSGLHSQQLENEYPVVRLAYAAGLPIAEPIFFEPDPAAMGLRFCVSKRVAGRNLGSFREAAGAVDDAVVQATAELLARLSHVHPDPADADVQASHLRHGVRHRTLTENTDALVDYWLGRAKKWGVASPSHMRLYHWLKANIPVCEDPPSLVHGDFGFHNILFEGARVSALLDWEASCAGDPANDMANLFFGTAGVVDRDQVMTFYNAAGGRPISAERLRFFDVFNTFKMATGSLVPLYSLDQAEDAPISFAVLGLNYLSFIIDRVNGVIEGGAASSA